LSFLNLFKEGIRIGGVEELVDPEYGVELFVAGVGDVVGVPDGHVDIGGFFAGKMKLHDFICSDSS